MRYVVNNSPLTREKTTGIELVSKIVVQSISQYNNDVHYVNWGRNRSKFYKVLWSLILVNFCLCKGDIYISTDGIAPVFRRKGVKYLTVVHDKIWATKTLTFEYFYYRLGVRGFHKWVYPIFVSKNSQLAYGSDDTRSRVIYNINVKDKPKFTDSKSGFVIIAPSSLRKNFYNQLVAWYLATKHSPNGCNLNIVGSHLKQELKEFLGEYPLAKSRIKVLGYITESQKTNLLRKSRFVLCASKSEGLGHPFIEAIEFGCIPIAWGLPSYKELIVDSAQIPFAKSFSANDLTTFLNKLLSNQTLQIQLQDNLRVIAKKWSKYNCIEEYTKCFQYIETI